ncbi:MAG: hypothetical protein H6R41_184, partial [Deltaproteobacteria bacterium]|nr:hypothetical protein [Deltaproteobacteria bacterium]MBS1243647.1 hypothetical protein [Deltaproteobacteria bacterium]
MTYSTPIVPGAAPREEDPPVEP